MNSSKELFAKGHLILTFVRGLFLIAEDDIRQNIKNYDITHTGFRTLWILFFDEKLNMTELAYISQTNISNIYRQLVKLKDQNYVVIDTGEDARVKNISLTPHGRQFVQEVISKNVKVTNLQLISLLSRIPEEDLDKFIEVASLLSTELIGQGFTDWAIRVANNIRNF